MAHGRLSDRKLRKEIKRLTEAGHTDGTDPKLRALSMEQAERLLGTNPVSDSIETDFLFGDSEDT